jgi:hypothetical protein
MGDDRLPDHYEILGVSPSATPEEITKAYRQMLRVVHPDASGTSGLFRLVKTAHDTLKDPQSRAAYDARRRLPDPPPDVSRPAPPPPPPRRPSEHAGPAEPPPSPPPETSPESSRDDRVRPVRAFPRVRPGFGAHWKVVAAVGGWTAAWLIVLVLLWPATVPAGLVALLVLPVLAAPIIPTQVALRSRPWVWVTCVAPFAATSFLAGTDAHPYWPFAGALAGLALGGTGLALAPYVVDRGRRLDALVSRDSLEHQIFNVPGAGLVDAAARDAAMTNAACLEGLAAMDGVRIVHGLTPPQLPGTARCHVEHVVLRDDRLAVIVARRWPAATYAWTERGTLTADGRRFPGGDTGIVTAVRAFRRVMPRGIQVRGFVSVLPDGATTGTGLRFLPAENDEVFAGTVDQVRGSVAAWLDDARPVLRRRAFAALLPHVRRP